MNTNVTGETASPFPAVHSLSRCWGWWQGRVGPTPAPAPRSESGHLLCLQRLQSCGNHIFSGRGIDNSMLMSNSFLFFSRKENPSEGGFLSRLSKSWIKTRQPSQCWFSFLHLLCPNFVFNLLECELRCIFPLSLQYPYFSDLIETWMNAHWHVLRGDKAALMYHPSKNCSPTQPSLLLRSLISSRSSSDTGPATSRWFPITEDRWKRMMTDCLKSSWITRRE